MKGTKPAVLNLAEKCKNILASNWQGQLNTVKADAKGSKEGIFSSKVKYFVKRGRPYIWVPEKEQHNVNTIIDERVSFAISSPYPGPLKSLLKSIKKLPARVALAGDVVSLKPEKCLAHRAAESLQACIESEERAIKESSYTVSGVLSSSSHLLTSRSENLKALLDEGTEYVVYKFNISSWMWIDGHGRTHKIDLEDMAKYNADKLAPFSAQLIDGINQSEARRRALMILCLTYLNASAKDAYMLSVDRKGFDVLGKVRRAVIKDGAGEYQWKEFRFTFKEEASDIETFCRLLVEMEEEALKKVSSFSGLT
ncbi:uncharacterized protein [Rutidosis leptorrhynchoides]|uniref:uncharacterized protein n=1 Tax=Rutidosis leptorrhynchoides TaxID=125765 RepID=UPI003A99B784